MLAQLGGAGWEGGVVRMKEKLKHFFSFFSFGNTQQNEEKMMVWMVPEGNIKRPGTIFKTCE